MPKIAKKSSNAEVVVNVGVNPMKAELYKLISETEEIEFKEYIKSKLNYDVDKYNQFMMQVRMYIEDPKFRSQDLHRFKKEYCDYREC